jgi:hypothetical protein
VGPLQKTPKGAHRAARGKNRPPAEKERKKEFSLIKHKKKFGIKGTIHSW